MNEELYERSNIKGMYVHIPLGCTETKSLHLTCLKSPPPEGAWKDIDICINRWKFQLNLQPLYSK